ncbi:MAG: hypothetical protein IT536_05035 [Hyphomicrobiales bacterium]|nr:hypothetical protein [Hyphomicrobiales bacterium]
MRCLAVFAGLLIGAGWMGSARAEITVLRAEYAGGVLVVRGETSRPNQIVTLDRRYRTRTNRYGEFRFRIPYLPSDCLVTIRAGQEVRPARVANCDMRLRGLPGRPVPERRR